MIINFGSINVDIVMTVDKLPTPGDTILCPNYRVLPGGKGANQAKAAAMAGSQVSMYGQVGEDEFAAIALDSLKKAQVNVEGVRTNASPTGCAMVSVDERGENIITVASGANSVVRARCVPDTVLTDATTLMLQMEVSPTENWEMLKRARQQHCRTVLNLAPAKTVNPEALAVLDYLIMNEVEARLLARDLKVPTSDLSIFSEFLAKKFDLTAIVTQGNKGAFAYSKRGEHWQVSAMDIDAVDTTGAGDAFVGIFAAMLDQGKDTHTALHYAVVGSGLCCLRAGAESISDLRTLKKNLRKVAPPVQLS